MSMLSILKRFRDSYVSFIDELMELFPEEVKLIPLRVFFVDQIPVQIVADKFVEHILPYKSKIVARDDDYFMEDDSMFEMLHQDGKTEDVLHFKKLWTSSSLDEEDRDAIWRYFNTFIVLIEKYKELREKTNSLKTE